MLALVVSVVADGGEIPPAPEGRVLDEARLFAREPERLAEVSWRLETLVQEHRMPVYLAIYGALIDGRIDQRSRQLHEAWIGEGQDGVVVVWDSDTGDLEFGLPRATYYDAGLEPGWTTRLPDQRLRPVLDEVRAGVEGVADKKDFVERLTEVLASRLDQMLEQGGERRGGSTGTVIAGTVVAGGLLSLLGLWAGRFKKRVEEAPRRKCYFPDVLIGARLGASRGGGRVAVVDFNREEPEEVE